VNIRLERITASHDARRRNMAVFCFPNV